MESLGTAVLELVANIKPLAAGLAEGKAEAESMAKTTATGFKGGITKAAIPAAAALGAVVVGLHKSVDAAQADQVEQAKLTAAYKAAGLNIADYKGKIDDAERSSANLGFKSADVKTSLASLIVATHDSGKAISLLSTAQDIARFKGVSLEAATKMLTMAQSGSTRAVKQLGLQVQATTTEQDKARSAYEQQKQALEASLPSVSKMTEAQRTQYDQQLATLQVQEKANLAIAKTKDTQATAAQVVDMVNQKLHGQADAFASTAEGAKEKMGAEFQLLEINIGSALIPLLTRASSVLANFSEFLTEHAHAVKIVLAVLVPFLTAILAFTVYVKLAAAAQWLMNAALGANPIGIVVIAIAALVVAFVELWQHSQTFRTIILGVWNDVKTATTTFLNFFTSTVPQAFDTVRGKIEDAFTAVKTWVSNHWPEIATIISGPFAPLVAIATNGFGVRSKLIGAFQAVYGWFKSTWSDVSSLIAAPFQAAWTLIKSVINLMIGGINVLIRGLDKIHFSIPGWVPGVGGKGFGINIPQIPMLAAGGIVNSPTLAMIGEGGPEAVVPLDGKHGLGNGITVNVSGWVGNDQDLATKIGRTLEQMNRRGTKFKLA